MILSILSDFCLIWFLIFYPQTSLSILKDDDSYKIACNHPYYVCLCVKKKNKKEKIKREKK